MVDIVQRRYANWESYISRNVLEHLAWLSGGNITRYFSLIRLLLKKAALATMDFPVSDLASNAVKQAISEEASPLQWLIAEDRRWLKLIRQSGGQFPEEIKHLETDFTVHYTPVRSFPGAKLPKWRALVSGAAHCLWPSIAPRNLKKSGQKSN